MADLTFVTGGARSGKSRFAEARALERADQRQAMGVCYLATAEVYDEEFSQRIARHREQRNRRFVTVEEPLDLGGGLLRAHQESPVVLLECITTWLANVFQHQSEGGRESFALEQIDGVLKFLSESPGGDLIVVTNELGMGVVPLGESTRHYCDVHGRINQRLAQAANQAWLLVSGLPLRLK